MSSIFTETSGRKLGYNPEQVDLFMEKARAAFEEAEGHEPVSSREIRSKGFDLVKHGYEPDQVDGALDRLEDVFVDRERQRGIAQLGEAEWLRQAQSQASAVVARLQRPRGERFRRGGLLTVGYDVKQVDALGDRIVEVFTVGGELTISELRDAVFLRKSRGYDEAQVDALLDAVVEVLQAIQE